MRLTLVAASLSALLTACGGASSQGITGRIVDRTGAPVSRAEVSTVPPTDLALTNDRGAFNLRATVDEKGESTDIEPGDYKLIVKKLGFADLSVPFKYEGGLQELPPASLAPRDAEFDETAPDETRERPVGPGDTSIPVQNI